MQPRLTCLAISALFYMAAPSLAIEGNSAAGPIGGTDIRNAMLPPPGLWGGGIYVHAVGRGFTDGNGDDIAALAGLDLTRDMAAAFLIYVPPVQVLGGSIGFGGVVSGGEECGRLFAVTPSRCITGFGDIYLEADWSRFFGQLRPSQYPGAFPIPEGLTVELGFGMVVPTGRYDAVDAQTQGLSLGSNVWDFAPLAAVTYITPPVLAEGTEFSAKVYLNNYLTNPATNYDVGKLVNVDFAITEHIGRLQLGLAGAYLTQIDDDRVNGIALPPDGRRASALNLGGIVALDVPELGGSMKLKIMTDVTADNFVHSHGVAFSFIKKLD